MCSRKERLVHLAFYIFLHRFRSTVSYRIVPPYLKSRICRILFPIYLGLSWLCAANCLTFDKVSGSDVEVYSVPLIENLKNRLGCRCTKPLMGWWLEMPGVQRIWSSIFTLCPTNLILGISICIAIHAMLLPFPSGMPSRYWMADPLSLSCGPWVWSC